MPKTKQTQLPTHYGEGLLVSQMLRTVPMQVVKDALVATRNNDLREKNLPKRNLAYFVIGLGLFPDLSYTETFRTLEQARQLLLGQEPTKVPAVSSLVEGRQRLGYASMKEIFDRVAKPIGVKGQSKGTHFAGRVVVAIDGVVFDLQDTPENEEFFGRSQSQHGGGAFPQVRCVAFIECGTHVVFDFEFSDEEGKSEQALGRRLLSRARRGHLVIADRLYCDGEKWSTLIKTGADGIFRVKSDVHLPVLERYADDSYRSVLIEGDSRKQNAIQHSVRVVEYRVGKQKTPYRLITSLSVQDAAAADIARMYMERWNWESSALEFKHVLSSRTGLLRSNTPELVKQELVGIFLAHNAIRWFMHEAALSADVDVDTLSFKHSLHVIRRNVDSVGVFSP